MLDRGTRASVEPNRRALANPVPINLTHLNPVLANLPQHLVWLERPAQLCLPVAKNGAIPPND